MRSTPIAGLAVLALALSAAAPAVGGEKTPAKDAKAAAREREARPENLLIADLLRNVFADGDEEEDDTASAEKDTRSAKEKRQARDKAVDAAVADHARVPVRAAKQIREAAGKKNPERALLELYAELNKRDMAPADTVFLRSLDKLNQAEYDYRLALNADILAAFGDLPADASNRAVAAVWRKLVYGSLEEPFRVAALGIERDKLQRDRERDRQRDRGLVRYLSLKKEEIENPPAKQIRPEGVTVCR